MPHSSVAASAFATASPPRLSVVLAISSTMVNSLPVAPHLTTSDNNDVGDLNKCMKISQHQSQTANRLVASRSGDSQNTKNDLDAAKSTSSRIVAVLANVRGNVILLQAEFSRFRPNVLRCALNRRRRNPIVSMESTFPRRSDVSMVRVTQCEIS